MIIVKQHKISFSISNQMDTPGDSLDFINSLTAKQLQTVCSHFENA